MNIGFVSTRFSGTDGVSLEARKWATVLERSGHRCFWFCGLSDHAPEVSFLVNEAHFDHPEIDAINNSVWGCENIPEDTSLEIEQLRRKLHAALHTFRKQFSIDLIIVENAVTIPMNLPLGLAVSDFLEESGIPSIAHHHDFYWERERFGGRAVQPFLDRAFPPKLPDITHAVINSAAKSEMKRRFGLETTLVPNVMDFARPLPAPNRSREEVRTVLGLADNDRLILQPTRVVPRKGIEHAIELLHQLADERNRLIVSHDAGDEGFGYRIQLEKLASYKGVDLRFVSDRVAGVPSADRTGHLTLEDLYPVADFVTFPSLYEGFGNALLEAVYFKKPLLVNRYSVFRDDIERCGLHLVVMDGEVTTEVVAQVRERLESPESFVNSAEENFRIASAHFGFETLAERLDEMLQASGLG